MSGLGFIKMHGIGNDFVVLDFRLPGPDGAGLGARGLDPALARAIADRHTGIGCDQVIAVAASETGLADVSLRFYNADGSESGACGNGTRCVAAWLMAENGGGHVVLETAAGLLDAERAADGRITVDMGRAREDWREIPLAEAADTLHLGIGAGGLADPVAVNIGNPHAVFFVDDADAVDLAALGPKLEHHKMFPERANIGVAQIVGPGEMRLRVWERGAGITLACGSGACAAVVAASRRGLAGRQAEVRLDGGTLSIEWAEDGHVLMTGPVAVSFTGELGDGLAG